MHTQEHQWRFLNTVALHELNNLERSSFVLLSNLSDRLDKLHRAQSNLQSHVHAALQTRHTQQLAPVMARLMAALTNLQPGWHAVQQSAKAVRAPRAFADEAARFCRAADRFVEAAAHAEVAEIAGVATGVGELASVVEQEVSVVLAAAAQVLQAGVVTERSAAAVVAANAT